MFTTGILALVLGATTPQITPPEATRWAHLRPGITREQVCDALGEPLMRNAARGCERWVYDNASEVVFTRGLVSAWTSPRHVAPPAPPAIALTPVQPERRT